MSISFTGSSAGYSFGRLVLVLPLVAVLLSSDDIEASRARPRTVAATENVRLAMPRNLADAAEAGLTGIEFEVPALRESALKQVARYVQSRRAPRRGKVADLAFEKECATPENDVAAAICAYETDRRARPETTTELKRSKSERREVAGQLIEEHWEAVQEIPYQGVVGIIGSISTKAELLQMGKSLGSKSECVGSKAATAIAYKLEEHFPDIDSVDVARSLYKYAANCGTDFAAAKAAYRLALLDVWRNDCSRVPDLMLRVEASPDAGQFRSRAKYWRAYCSEVLGRRESSKEARESLLFEFPMTFHNLAANGTQGSAVDWITRDTSPPIAFRSLVRPDMNGFLRSMEAMIKLGSSDLAAEFADRSTAKIQQLEPEVRLYIAAMLHKNGHALTKFKIMSSLFQDSPRTVSGPTMRLYFPLGFYDVVEPHSGRELDPLLVTALIRQESAFNINARSRVGARGLMQLMPATARMLAPVRPNRLFDPNTNVALGTQYLRKRLAQYGGDVELTLAAYNAGFARVDEWRKRYPTENRILFLDLIPFRETRDYVSSILRNYYWYTKLYGAEIAMKRSPSSELASSLSATLLPSAAAESSAVAAESSATTTTPTGVAAIDLSMTYQAITRAQSGLIVRPPAP